MSQPMKCPLCAEALPDASVGSVVICLRCGMSSRLATSPTGTTVAEEVPMPSRMPADLKFSLFIVWGLATTMVGTVVLLLAFVVFDR